jgi:hypothetical protein
VSTIAPSASSVQEILDVEVKPGFNPATQMGALIKHVMEANGEGWKPREFDRKKNVVRFVRRAAIDSVTATGPQARRAGITLELAADVKEGDGPRKRREYEDAYRERGFAMTKFDAALGRIVLEALTPAEVHARDAIANAMGLSKTPWLIEVIETTDEGGFRMRLPATYAPVRHDKALTEAVESVVGKDGWFVSVDPRTFVATITPGIPPTFPRGFAYPLDLLGQDPHRIRVGKNLAKNGQDPQDAEETIIDFTAAHGGLVAGLPRSGKSVFLRALLADSIASGSEAVIITTPNKKVDFTWCRDMVRDGGWGCESLREAVAALGMVYAEGERRSALLDERGVENWFSLPAGTLRPLLVIVDEFAVLSAKEAIPAGVPKDDPDKIAAMEKQRLKNRLIKYVTESIAEMGFVGIRVVLSSQVTNSNTGLPPSVKSLLGHSALIGANPSKNQRAQSFKDETTVPVVPQNIRDDSYAAKGTGTLESEGCESTVFKSYFAESDDYRQALLRKRVPMTSRPQPNAFEIAKFTPPPLEGDYSDDIRPASGLDDGGFGQTDGRDAEQPRLRGAAAAAHQLAVEAAQARVAAGGGV